MSPRTIVKKEILIQALCQFTLEDKDNEEI